MVAASIEAGKRCINIPSKRDEHSSSKCNFQAHYVYKWVIVEALPADPTGRLTGFSASSKFAVWGRVKIGYPFKKN